VSSHADRRIVIGRISGLFGVRGWVKLFSYTDPMTNLLEFSELQLGSGGKWRPAVLAEGRSQGKTLVGRFEGVTDRDQAAGLVGADIAIRRDQLPEPKADEVYWTDLIGLAVVNVHGEALGTVDRLLETGANDVLVLRGDRERLVPFVRGAVVKDIDQEAGRITVDWDRDY
jgi:16S rRNA processing protein RimM